MIVARSWVIGCVCPHCGAEKLHPDPQRDNHVFCFGCGRWDDDPQLVAMVAKAREKGLTS